MKFRYYITNTFDGKIEGTNNVNAAIDYAQSEDFFVLDSEIGIWLLPDGGFQDIEEVKATGSEGDAT